MRTERQKEKPMLKKLLVKLNSFFLSPFSLGSYRLLSWFLIPLTIQIVLLKSHKLLLLGGSFAPKTLFLIFRMDLLALLLFGSFFLYWQARTKGWFKSLGFFLLQAIFWLLMTFSLIEHAFYIISGTIGDWYILRYTVINIKLHYPLFLTQLKSPSSLLLLLPVLFIVLTNILKKKAKRTEKELQEKKAWIRPLHIFFSTGLLSLTWLLPLGLTGFVKPLEKNIFVRVVTRTEGANKQLTKAARSLAQKKPLLFNTHSLRFTATKKSNRKNVVIIMLETSRARSLTPYNPKIKTTPFLAKLARKSLMVEYMYPVIPHTSKAMVSILCGIPPKIIMDNVEGYVSGIPGRCLPKLLKEHGYQSAHFQPANLHFEYSDQMFQNMGYGTIKGLLSFPLKGFQRTNSFGYEDRIMLKPMMQWVDKARSKSKPFLLSMITLTPHFEYNTPSDFRKKIYQKTDDPELHKYLNALHYTDLFLKDLFKEFKKRGLLRSTFFVMIGDHGEAFGEHGRRQHDNGMWEEIVRIPALIYNPELIKHGKRIKGLRQQTDILPTIADLLGYKIKSGVLPGKSLLRPVSKDRKLYMSCWYEKHCISWLQGRTKYIYNYQRYPMEKFDLSKDPQEKVNLLRMAQADPKRFKAMRELLEWRERVNFAYETPDLKELQKIVTSDQPKFSKKIGLRLGSFISVIGYKAKRMKLSPGSALNITIIFQALKKIPKKWKLFCHVSVKKTEHFLNMDHNPLGGSLPPSAWPAQKYIQDKLRFRVPDEFPTSGILQIHVGLWASGEKRQPVLTEKGEPIKSPHNRLLIAEFILQKQTAQPSSQPVSK